MNFRIESDSIGSKKINSVAYYGVQTLRAVENFRITGLKMNEEFINSLAKIKKAAAMTNMQIECLDKEKGRAILQACDEIILGKLHEEFIVDPIQGGAGTSMNMNANEVIANRAIEILKEEKGNYNIIHPNDHVNMGQSTNDVIPTAGKITAFKFILKLIKELDELYKGLDKKSKEFYNVIKMGRTQMQDAVPVRLGQEFKAYASVIKRDVARLKKIKEDLKIVNIGGTAIGTCINTNEDYQRKIIPNLNMVSEIKLKQAEDLIDGTQNLDCFVALSSVIKTCAVNLSKMANDLRLMSSGPRTGFGEINLPAKQNGSSIMPGKVNPVIPEVINQIAFNIIGNDLTITMAAEGGQLELNAFEPVLFFKVFESMKTLINGVNTFTKNCINGISANENRCKELVDNSVGIITAICPYIGYKEASRIAKEAIETGESVKKIIINEGIFNEDKLESILNPIKMTKPQVLKRILL